MLSGWIRAFGLIAMAALLANAQCYNTCALLACNSAQTPSNDCHQHKSSHEDSSGCRHQHFEFMGPESGIAKIIVAPAVPVVAVLAADPAVVLMEPLVASQPDTGSPPGAQTASAISVLRI
jgi:hypothetical protein